ncbi:MAG TPA: hypothetical protein VGN86_16025 [Pyrinomonadaceae bacterium]|nr:hypothetical protein [Pyrinomonadaceae bacterium]
MALIRLIHRDHYNAKKGRFQDLAFKNSRDGSGISVVDCDCADGVSVNICSHVERYYPAYRTPTIFWTIREARLPDEFEAAEEPSNTGDACHRNLKGISANEADKIRKAITVDECSICDDGAVRDLNEDDLPPNPYPPSP